MDKKTMEYLKTRVKKYEELERRKYDLERDKMKLKGYQKDIEEAKNIKDLSLKLEIYIGGSYEINYTLIPMTKYAELGQVLMKILEDSIAETEKEMEEI
ncbi:hypothetical protein CLTEP_02630 [Clostridium tepidiprofundi DSM 19306]|uniref:Uncharacterized protein n=1 Tax=Clostridium tepidiprofundi DSM 19306 TaxID=1121338 RepID=A0A151B7V7_9CLOT|nr:hypothetical protein [Clostridium tepidiprofundi]KYH35870.1 hypothetical protein CLTEP_02630 [Clostridium tepidiprofundi DSM 19306]